MCFAVLITIFRVLSGQKCRGNFALEKIYKKPIIVKK